MPEYQVNKTYRGGFYKNKVVNGNDDRSYSAEDIRKPYDVVFSDGIKPDVDGTAGDILQVSANGGMTIAINKGYAKLGGAWFENTAPYTITLDNPIASNCYDCIILRNDDSDDVREPSIYVKRLSTIPTVNDLTRNDNIYEVCLAYIVITSSTTEIRPDDIIDTRLDGALCNVMTGVGATIFRTYKSTYFSESVNQSVIPIGIPEYKSLTDELVVSVEGKVFTETTQYEIVDDETIRLVIGLPVVGTKIEFIVRKNVNGSANEDINQEVTQLITDTTNIKKQLEHHYYCNGTNDNILLGNMVKSFLTGSGYGSAKINIHGKFGAVAPALTNSSTDYWFDFNVTSKKKVIVDFSDCSELNLPTTNGKTNVIFYGKEINLVGASLPLNNPIVNTTIVMFDGSANIVNCENCRFWITANKNSYISRTGTFTNCRGSVTNSSGYSYCFYTNNLIRVNGGEYYAYTADSSGDSAVVCHSGSTAVTILYGVNAPTVARGGYYQTHSVIQLSAGILSCTDLISELPLDVMSGYSNIRGTIAINKPDMM